MGRLFGTVLALAVAALVILLPATSHAIDTDIFGTVALLISLIGIFAIGLFPTPLFNAAGAAARALLP